MNWTWNIILSGAILVLIAWCHLNTNFINDNAKRMEKIEKIEKRVEKIENLPRVDSVYIINNFKLDSKIKK